MGPTEMRLLLMIGNVFLIYHPRIYHQRYLLYDFGGVIAIIGMAFILVILTIQHTHARYKLARLPKQSREATAFNGVQSSTFSWGHGVSTGSASDRVSQS